MKILCVIAVTTFSAHAQFPNTFLGSLAVGSDPVDICISPDGQRAYAAVAWGFATAVDINGYGEISLAGLVDIDGEPAVLQCDESGEFLYVADTENSLVHVVNTVSLSVEGSFPVQPFPEDMVLCPEENCIFLSHSSGLVTVINTDTRLPDGVFWAGCDLNSLCVSPDGAYLYAPDNGSPLESVISTSSGYVNRVTSGMDSRCCAISGDGGRLFLSCVEWGLIGVMNTEDLTMEASIACPGSAPLKMAALPDLPFLYCLQPEDGVLSVYGTDDLAFKGNIAIPGQPENLAVHPDGERIFLVCTGDNTMKVYGFDPAGIEAGGTGITFSPAASPSAFPAVRLTCVTGGTVILRGFDVSGRNVWREQTVLSDGETREFLISGAPEGVLLVTAETPSGISSTSVLVLKP